MDITALASRLRADDEAQALSLASNSISTALPAARENASRLLLAATPPAIRRLRAIAESGSDKDAVAASNIILSKSPATKDEAISSSGNTLSNEALTILMSGLAGFATALRAGGGFAADESAPMRSEPGGFADEAQPVPAHFEHLKENP